MLSRQKFVLKFEIGVLNANNVRYFTLKCSIWCSICKLHISVFNLIFKVRRLVKLRKTLVKPKRRRNAGRRKAMLFTFTKS